MKNGLLRRTRLMIASFCLSLSLSSCSFLNSGEGTQIKDVITTYDETNGNTVITITFTDEDASPVTFSIPRGIAGKDGVSIKNVSSKLSGDGNSIELTISYDDSSVEDTVLSFPVLQGRGVEKVLIDKDESGNPTIQFVYTDGSKSPLISIPNGKDGNGIESFEVSDPDANGKMTISVLFSDGSKKTFEVKNGVSVKNIVYNEEKSDATHYVLTITYSDGYEEDVCLDRPRSNRWYTGTTEPEKDSASEEALEGDFYLNRMNGNVYQRQSGGGWLYLFSMKADSSYEEKVYHTVYFDPGEGKINGNSSILMATVLEGSTMNLSAIPVPTYEDYSFLGWYTDKDSVNAGKFSDLTPVLSDLSLFARYA